MRSPRKSALARPSDERRIQYVAGAKPDLMQMGVISIAFALKANLKMVIDYIEASCKAQDKLRTECRSLHRVSPDLSRYSQKTKRPASRRA